MKVKVKQSHLLQHVTEPKQSKLNISPTARLHAEEDMQEAVRSKLKETYYSLFPDDPIIGYNEESTGPCNDAYEVSMFRWAIENKRHWYEFPNLSDAYFVMPFTHSSFVSQEVTE